MLHDLFNSYLKGVQHKREGGGWSTLFIRHVKPRFRSFKLLTEESSHKMGSGYTRALSKWSYYMKFSVHSSRWGMLPSSMAPTHTHTHLHILAHTLSLSLCIYSQLMLLFLFERKSWCRLIKYEYQLASALWQPAAKGHITPLATSSELQPQATKCNVISYYHLPSALALHSPHLLPFYQFPLAISIVYSLN